PVADSEIVRRRSHHKIDACIRQARHSCGAILSAKFKFGHRKNLASPRVSYKQKIRRVFYFPGSTGCQPVLFGSLPKSSSKVRQQQSFPRDASRRQAADDNRPAACAPQIHIRVRPRIRLSFSVADKPSKLKIADREFASRLLVGTGKFASNELMRDALVASGTELVTVALRRADLSGKHDPFANILDFIDPKRFLLLPNTSGARNAEEAVRLARLSASAGLPTWIKLEIHPDPRYLLPDPVETLAAAEVLVKEGFTVLPYINADPVLAKRLQ